MIQIITEFIKKRQYKSASAIKKSHALGEIKRMNRYIVNPHASLNFIDTDMTTDIYIQHLSSLINMADIARFIDIQVTIELKQRPYYNYVIILLFLMNYNDCFRIARNNYMTHTIANKAYIISTVKKDLPDFPILDEYIWLVILYYNYNYFTELGCCNRCFVSLLFPIKHIEKNRTFTTLTYSESIEQCIKEFIHNGIYATSPQFDTVKQLAADFMPPLYLHPAADSTTTISTYSLDVSPLPSIRSYQTIIPDIPEIFIMSAASTSANILAD